MTERIKEPENASQPGTYEVAMADVSDFDAKDTNIQAKLDVVTWDNPGSFPAFRSGLKSDDLKTTPQEPNGLKPAEVLSDEDFFMHLGDKNIAISSVPEVHDQLLGIPEDSRETFLFLIDNFGREGNWKPYFTAILNNFTNDKFHDLVQSASDTPEGVNFAALSKVLAHKDNYLDITSIDQLSNLDNIIDEKLRSAAEQGNIAEWENYALLQKYNLSADEAKILVQKYAYKIDDVQVDTHSAMKNFLSGLKAAITAKSPADFSKIISQTDIPSELKDYPDFQIEAQRMYSESFNSDLFDANNKEYLEEDGVRIVDAGADFKMIVRTDGAYFRDESEDNYAQRWAKLEKTNTMFSGSYIANDHLLCYDLMSKSKEPLITYGFSNLDEDAVLETALGDDATASKRKKTLDVSSYNDFRTIIPLSDDGCGQRFMTIPDIINDSHRSVYNENVISRFHKNEQGEDVHNRPSYVVYFKSDENFREDPRYHISKDAARDFAIPVVVVDIDKVLANESAKCRELEASLNDDWSVDKVVDIVQRYANNSILDTREGVSEAISRYFPETVNGKNVMGEFVAKQFATAPPEDRQKLFDQLMVLNAKKSIFPQLAMAKISHASPDIVANTSAYGEEIFGVTVNPQDKYFPLAYGRAETCIGLCEQYNLNLNLISTDKDVDNFLRNINFLQENNLTPDARIAFLDAVDLERRARECTRSGLDINADNLALSLDQLKKAADELKVRTISTSRESEPWDDGEWSDENSVQGDWGDDDWDDDDWDDDDWD